MKEVIHSKSRHDLSGQLTYICFLFVVDVCRVLVLAVCNGNAYGGCLLNFSCADICTRPNTNSRHRLSTTLDQLLEASHASLDLASEGKYEARESVFICCTNPKMALAQTWPLVDSRSGKSRHSSQTRQDLLRINKSDCCARNLCLRWRTTKELVGLRRRAIVLR